MDDSATAPVDDIDDDIPFWLEKIKLIKIKKLNPLTTEIFKDFFVYSKQCKCNIINI